MTDNTVAHALVTTPFEGIPALIEQDSEQVKTVVGVVSPAIETQGENSMEFKSTDVV